MRERPRRALFALLPLVALLGVSEGLARLLTSAPQEAPADFEGRPGILMRDHPTRMWALRPGVSTGLGVTTRVGEDGLRSVTGSSAPLRLLTTGDSSVFGHALEHEDTLHERLRLALVAQGLEAEVRCGAVPGYSTEQTLQLMAEVGWDLEPDLLVVGNLWSDNNVDGFVDREWMEQLASPAQRAEGVLSRSRLWQLLRGGPRAHPLPVTWIRSPDLRGRRRVPLDEYAANLDALLAEAARREIGAVLLAPCNAIRLARSRSEADWDVYFEAMARVAAHRGVPLVDARAVLDAVAMRPPEAFLDDMHPTGLANGAYAQALARSLVEAGWPQHRLVPREVPPFAEVLDDTWWE